MPNRFLHGRNEIARYLGVSSNTLDAMYRASLKTDNPMPIRFAGNKMMVDKWALRQWLGLKLPGFRPTGTSSADDKVRVVTKADLTKIFESLRKAAEGM